MNIRTYSELIQISDYYDRFEYLKIGGKIGFETFGYDRYLNQILYASPEWRHFRDVIIIRDNGCDIAMPGFEIHDRLTVHHLNTLTKEDILNRDPKIFDPENVVCVSHNTHMAIHYGSRDLLPQPIIVRTQNDTCPWK